MTWGHFEIILGHIGVTLASLRGDLGLHWVTLADIGVTWASLWGDLGALWGHLGQTRATLGQLASF